MTAFDLASRQFSSVDELEKLVIHAATEYELNGYVEDFNGLEITDSEYDELVKILKRFRPDSKVFDGTSPSEAVASGNVVKHEPPMTSIGKADGTEEEKKAIYEHWINDCKSRLGVDKLKIAQSYKRDGVALRTNYVDGKLVSAGLRPRDGVNGTDVTHHVTNIRGVPKELPLPLTLSLNGEIECWFDDFKKVNAERDVAGEEQYKNPRNYTAGCLGRDNSSETKQARLRIAYYSITGFDEWANYYKNEIERAKWANGKNGLNLQEEGKGFFIQVRPHRFEDLAKLEENSKGLPYYTDGVILKVDDLELQEELGNVGDNPINEPRGALAWKYEEETAEAVVTSIEWNASRTGRIVPTAIFDVPFVLADTENTRATCNNYGWMESQGLGPGAKVKCKKGGKIIPNIMSVLEPVTDMGDPENCPSCEEKLALHTSSSGNRDLICGNKECPAKHIKGWVFYLQQLDCKGLGAAAVEQMLNSGHVKALPDLYQLKSEDLLEHGFSERQSALALAAVWKVKPQKNTEKLLEQIGKKQKVEIPAWQFFSALGIPGAGKTAGRALMDHFRNFDKIKNASVDDLVEIDGIGETTAQAIHDWFVQKGDMADELLQFVELEMPKSGKLNNTNFVFTGSFDQGKSYWEKQVQELGGKTQSSVGSKTHYLVQQHGKTDGSPSSKEKKAIDLGIPIISVKQLEQILN